jgi:O-antigen/teichoic acid export membrane protein
VLARVTAKVSSDGSLTKRASLNAVVAFADFGARIIVGLIVTPVLVRGLGSFLFGVWQVLQRLLGHAAVASGRPGEALKWVVAHEQSSTDYEEKRRQVGSAIVVWLIFLPVLTVLGAILSWFTPGWLNVPDASVTTVRVAAGVVAANFIVISLAYLPESVLHGENLAYKRLGRSTLMVFVGGGLTVLALALHTGIVGVAVAAVATTLLTGLMYLHIVRSQVPWFGVARPTRARVRRFVGLSWWFMVWNFVMQLMRSADFIVLGLAGSATLVTGYSLTRYIPDAVTMAAATMIFAAMPGLGGLIGAGDVERATGIRNETMSLTWLLTTAAGATMLVWERPFLDLWVGDKYYPGTTAMVLIVVMITQFAVIRTDSNIIDVTLEVRDKVLLGLLSAGVSVGIAIALLHTMTSPVTAIVAGFIIGRLILSVAYPLLIGRLLSVAPRRQLAAAVRPALATCALFALGAVLGRALGAVSWLTLVGGSIATAVAATVVAFAAGLPRGQRRLLVSRIRRVMQLT